MAQEPTVSALRDGIGSPYHLEKSQTLKASNALLKHIKSDIIRKDQGVGARNLLLASQDETDFASTLDGEPLWLVFTTKKYIVDKKRFKPGKIPLPHSIYNAPTTTICLITADPRRVFKDTINKPSFPPDLRSRLTRVIDISKLKLRYKSFESRRQLLAEHDVFLADDRIITMLPKLLGKIFYTGSKRPIPVRLEPQKHKDSREKQSATNKGSNSKPIAPPAQIAKEIQRTLSCAQVHLSIAATTAVRVGLASFSSEQVAENIDAVVHGMVEKFITQGWRNIRAIHVKGPNTMALPLWLTDELWTDENDILEKKEEGEHERNPMKAINQSNLKGRKRKNRESKDEGARQKVKKIDSGDLSKEMAERGQRLRQQKEEVNRNIAIGTNNQLQTVI